MSTNIDQIDDRDRRRYLKTLAALGVVGTTGIAGCLDEGSSSNDGGGSDTSLEVVHGWNAGDGKAAIEALQAAFEEEHSDIDVEFNGVGGDANTDLNSVIAQRLQNNDLMGSFANWPGQHLQRYKGVLMDVEESVWDEAGLKDVIHEATIEQHRFNDKMPGVPIGSHRMNNLFYNVSVFEQAGIDAGSLDSVDALISALETIGSETDAAPMAQLMNAPWGNLQLFVQILTSQAGVQTYMDFIDGNPDGAAIRSALESLRTILENHINGDASTLGMTETNDKVINGAAGCIHQGNWLYGAYRAADGFEYKTDWDWIPFPGTEGIYFYHLDSFIAPGDNPTPDLTEQWLRFVGTKKAQITFNAEKGSVPLRTDIDPNQLPEFLKITYEDLLSADQLPPTLEHGLAAAPQTRTACEEAFNSNFMGPFDVEATASALEEAVSN